jgi:hypothetical protein
VVEKRNGNPWIGDKEGDDIIAKETKGADDFCKNPNVLKHFNGPCKVLKRRIVKAKDKLTGRQAMKATELLPSGAVPPGKCSSDPFEYIPEDITGLTTDHDNLYYPARRACKDLYQGPGMSVYQKRFTNTLIALLTDPRCKTGLGDALSKGKCSLTEEFIKKAIKSNRVTLTSSKDPSKKVTLKLPKMSGDSAPSVGEFLHGERGFYSQNIAAICQLRTDINREIYAGLMSKKNGCIKDESHGNLYDSLALVMSRPDCPIKNIKNTDYFLNGRKDDAKECPIDIGRWGALSNQEFQFVLDGKESKSVEIKLPWISYGDSSHKDWLHGKGAEEGIISQLRKSGICGGEKKPKLEDREVLANIREDSNMKACINGDGDIGQETGYYKALQKVKANNKCIKSISIGSGTSVPTKPLDGCKGDIQVGRIPVSTGTLRMIITYQDGTKGAVLHHTQHDIHNPENGSQSGSSPYCGTEKDKGKGAFEKEYAKVSKSLDAERKVASQRAKVVETREKRLASSLAGTTAYIPEGKKISRPKLFVGDRIRRKIESSGSTKFKNALARLAKWAGRGKNKFNYIKITDDGRIVFYSRSKHEYLGHAQTLIKNWSTAGCKGVGKNEERFRNHQYTCSFRLRGL